MSNQKQNNPVVSVLAVIGGIVLLCCGGFAGFVFLGLLGTPVKTPAPPVTTTARAVIGATVEYHAPTLTPQPTASKVGTSRDNPYPVNSVVDIGSDMKLSIVFVKRPADDIIKQNIFVETPTPEQEYLIVAVHVDCTRSTNEKCSFSPLQLKTVGRDGKVYRNTIDSSMPNAMEMGNEFFGGGSVEGNVAFLALKGDATVIYYEPLFFGDPIYISLTK